MLLKSKLKGHNKEAGSAYLRNALKSMNSMSTLRSFKILPLTVKRVTIFVVFGVELFGYHQCLNETRRLFLIRGNPSIFNRINRYFGS